MMTLAYLFANTEVKGTGTVWGHAAPRSRAVAETLGRSHSPFTIHHSPFTSYQFMRQLHIIT